MIYSESQTRKQFGRDMTTEGWTFVEYDKPHYIYQTGNYKTGFKVMRLLDEDMTTENIALMVKLGVTR